MKKFRIYIGGISGVGKTVISRELARRHHMKHLSGSQIMMKLCKVNSREELSRIPKGQKLAIEKTTYPHLVARNQRVVVDGHCNLLPEQVKCFDKFIFLTAPVRIIRDRRQKRKRRWQDVGIQTIRMEQKEYQLRVSKTERLCGIKFVTVANTDNIAKTCGLIERILKWESKVQRTTA